MKPFYDGLQDAFARLHLAKFTPASSSSSSSPSSSSLHGEQLRTEDVTLISHTHGRERRAQRGIDKEALKAAVKHGKRSRANPGRAGDVRWRFEHNGVVYITDASCRQEITSWRVNGDKGDEGPAAFIQFNGNITTHTVLVVDHSGSMRKSDVPGFSTRTEAVYEAVASQFIQPQLSLDRTHLTSTTSTTTVRKQLGKAVVSLIEMGEAAHVVFQRQPLSQALFDTMKRRKQSYARSHGNYVPALEALDELLSQEDLVTDTPILILFLSDGAPSDHNALFCRHGVRVWEEDTDNPRMTKAKDGSLRPATKDCGFGNRCRSELKKKVEEHILKFIAYLGERFGQDRLRWHSVAFGPPLEDYKMLQQMASALPQGSFQKLGLAASSLHSALTSLTSTLTSLRTDGGTLKRTVRQDIEIRSSARNTPAAEAEDENGIMSNYDNTWDIYVSANSSFLTTSGTDIAYKIVRKIRYSSTKKDFVDEPMSKGADCVAVAGRLLDKGAERAVFRCSEGRLLPQLQGRPLDFQADMLGPILVAKESIHQEELKDMSFHSKMAKLHAKCQLFCEVFNRRIAFLGPSHQINYLQPVIYEVTDPYYPAGKAWILAEQRLEGKFTKWNNNAGGVRRKEAFSGQARAIPAINRDLGAIREEEEEEEEEGDVQDRIEVSDVPQCFSHFSWSYSDGSKLICDIQGVWNDLDGFILTDPVIHTTKKKNGATDRGRTGIDHFFASHKCGPLRRLLGLKKYDAKAAVAAALIDITSSSPIRPTLNPQPHQPSSSRTIYF